MPAPHALTPLSTLSPPSTARTWHSSPHPNLPLLATACADKTVRIYSLTSFTLLSTITGGHRRSVRTSAWKPQATKTSAPILATGSFDASAAIWVGQAARDVDARGGFVEEEEDEEGDDYNFAVVLEGHDSEIKSLSWSAGGTYLATCSRDKSVWIWEALASGDANQAFGYANSGDDDEDNYETVAVLQEHDGDVKCVVWHPTEETCLASSSYDEAVRVWREDLSDGEWGCVAVLEGHTGTVWAVDWESGSGGGARQDRVDTAASTEDNAQEEKEASAISGPRLISCSDDKTIRVWRRRPKVPKPAPADGPRIRSTIISSGNEEQWYEEAQLPQIHERAIYAVGWSKHSGKVVSAGSDGRIVVYEETAPYDDNVAPTWKIVAEIEGAHGVFEINHVCWAKRWDRAKSGDDEEVIISTGDDGEVKVWTLTSL